MEPVVNTCTAVSAEVATTSLRAPSEESAGCTTPVGATSCTTETTGTFTVLAGGDGGAVGSTGVGAVVVSPAALGLGSVTGGTESVIVWLVAAVVAGGAVAESDVGVVVDATGAGAAGAGAAVSVAGTADVVPCAQPASVDVVGSTVADVVEVVAPPVVAVEQPAVVPPVAVVSVAWGSVAVPVDVPSPAGAGDVSVVELPGSVLDGSGAVVAAIPSFAEVVAVSVAVVAVPASEPAVAAGGVVPLSAAAGYATTPTPTSMATRTANRAANEHSNRLNWSLWATALLLPTISRLLPRQSRPLVSATIVRHACPLVITRTDWENTPRRPKRTALKT